MHELSRQVRFSIDPFADIRQEGFNSYCSKPTSENLAIYLALWVALAGETNPETGFVVNVVDIDRAVRQHALPAFETQISNSFKNNKPVKLTDIAELLRTSWTKLKIEFGAATLKTLSLELNPFRKLGIDSEDGKMIYFSEKFEFAASHTLWNEKFSDEENFKVFGKCANPAGHGHNYVIAVEVKSSANDELRIGDYERTIDSEFITLIDHKNLNVDVPHFQNINPTVENIAAFAWDKLQGKFAAAQLNCVTVWENERTYCRYRRDT